MTKFSHQIELPLIDAFRGKADVLTIATTDLASHLNLTLKWDRLFLLPNEAIQLRDALIQAYPIVPETFSEIKVGDVVTVSLTVAHISTYSDGLKFRLDAPEWFNAYEAIGYVAPPKTPMEAGQVRRNFPDSGMPYTILVTPLESDHKVVCRYKPDSQVCLLDRSYVEAAKVVS
jgi:hypothetical protein